MELQKMIDVLTYHSKIHVCIHDLSGILCGPLQIAPKYTIHSKACCDSAKTTTKGMRLCMSCKILANQKAVESKTPFVGQCPLGITEIAVPVVIHGSTAAIIYLGNIVQNVAQTTAKMRHVSRRTGVDLPQLLRHIPQMQPANDLSPYLLTAQLICDCIQLLSKDVKTATDNHWAVEALKGYVAAYYNRDMTLSGLAKLYYLNANYIGRLFQKQTGLTFCAYLNQYRVEEAKKLLRSTSLSVIDIAMRTGFNNVTYFNRIFKRLAGKTPSEYRGR